MKTIIILILLLSNYMEAGVYKHSGWIHTNRKPTPEIDYSDFKARSKALDELRAKGVKLPQASPEQMEQGYKEYGKIMKAYKDAYPWNWNHGHPNN